MKNLMLPKEHRAILVTELLKGIAYAAIPAGLFYWVAMLIMESAGFSILQIVRDPAQQTEQSSLLGFLSNIGTWLWVSSAAICFFGAIYSRALSSRKRELLILIGVLSLILAVDDFFMIHDRYIRQRFCYLFYAIAAGALALRHYRTILREDSAFILAGGLLALSCMTDVFQSYIPLPYVIVQAIEDGFKFVGQGVWLFFAFRTAAPINGPALQKPFKQGIAE